MENLKFIEVFSGYDSEEDVDLLRVAESNEGDVLTLVKMKDEEQYQIALIMHDGREACDVFFEREFADSLFQSILQL
jgi:hypothetical protein